LVHLGAIETDVEVKANAGGIDSGESAGSTVLGTQAVERLSDDPDDLLSELQTMVASAGGAAGGAIISVDGFQNGSPLHPKVSIAEIRINPDPFSSQYERALWIAPRIEIITKPGVKAVHGALFFVENDGAFNATDPFSVTATPASNQRQTLTMNRREHRPGVIKATRVLFLYFTLRNHSESVTVKDCSEQSGVLMV
jgi:hypothetical protein